MDENPLTDAAGITHEPAGRDPRIVSLVPSITELLFNLGLGAHVVGRTAFCVHPRQRLKAVKSVGGTKKINFGKLQAVDPTHVIVNVDETPKRLAERIAAAGRTVVVTHPVEVRDNLALYRLIGGVFDRRGEAEDLCARFETAYQLLRRSATAWPVHQVLYLIWKDPWMTVSRDTYVSRMLSLAHWRTACHDADTRYPAIDITVGLLAETDIVLFSSEPFAFKDTHIEEFRAAFTGDAPILAPIDGQMVSWYGSRAILGLTYLKAFAARLPPRVRRVRR